MSIDLVKFTNAGSHQDVYVNPANVTQVTFLGDYAAIYFGKDDYVAVTESLNDVKDWLRRGSRPREA